MKKIILVLVLIISAGLTLNSCQTDDSAPNQKLSKNATLINLLMRVSHEGLIAGRDGDNDDNDDENENEDIDCINIVYPLTFTVNDGSGNTTSVTLNNDAELYAFLSDFEDNGTMTINYPVTISTLEGETITINNNEQFEDAIEDCGDMDDDDNDDDDDDDDDDDNDNDDDNEEED
ncbi:hypothetical protein [Flavobacterium sp.]|uniref:hypothetical protein n=1 Tax=Flavobacterium sp. TaxID=239 RepID=UPI003D2A4C62